MLRIYVFIVIVCCTINILFAQSKIEQSKTELNSNPKPTTNPKPSNHQSSSIGSNNSCNNNIQNSSLTNGVFRVFTDMVGGVFFGKKRFEEHLQNKVSPYPYFNKTSGNYTDEINKKTGRLDVENNFLLSNENIFGNQLNIKLRPLEDFFIMANYFELKEFNQKLNNPSLSVFNFSFCYDRVRTQNFNFGWNIGATYVANSINKANLSFGLQGDIMANKYFNIATSAHWSTINGNPVNSFDIKYKIYLKKVSLHTGYTHLRIASPTYNFLIIGAGYYF